MAYKTILVHCNDKRRVARIVGAAVEVAEKFQAHLIGLSVSPQVRALPTGVPGTPDTLVIDERGQAYRHDNPEMKAAFEAAVQGRSLTAEWCEEDAGSAAVADVAARYASGADLIVAAQRDPLIWVKPAKPSHHRPATNASSQIGRMRIGLPVAARACIGDHWGD